MRSLRLGGLWVVGAVSEVECVGASHGLRGLNSNASVCIPEWRLPECETSILTVCAAKVSPKTPRSQACLTYYQEELPGHIAMAILLLQLKLPCPRNPNGGSNWIAKFKNVILDYLVLCCFASNIYSRYTMCDDIFGLDTDQYTPEAY